MKTNASPHYFTGREALADDSALTFVECQECRHGVSADIELSEDAGAFCVECLIGINDISLERVRANPAAWVYRATDAGRAFLASLTNNAAERAA